MSDQQPEMRWAPIPPPPKRRGRMWLIIGLAVAAVVLAGIALFFLLPRGGEPTPSSSASPSATPSPTPSATPTASPTPTATPTDPVETTPPVITDPPVDDPEIGAFQGRVGGWLTNAGRGLDLLGGMTGQDAVSVIDTLDGDAQRLSDAQPPSSIDAAWRDALGAYGQRLADLRAAITAGSNTTPAIDAARTSVQNLQGIIGL